MASQKVVDRLLDEESDNVADLETFISKTIHPGRAFLQPGAVRCGSALTPDRRNQPGSSLPYVEPRSTDQPELQKAARLAGCGADCRRGLVVDPGGSGIARPVCRHRPAAGPLRSTAFPTVLPLKSPPRPAWTWRHRLSSSWNWLDPSLTASGLTLSNPDSGRTIAELEHLRLRLISLRRYHGFGWCSRISRPMAWCHPDSRAPGDQLSDPVEQIAELEPLNEGAAREWLKLAGQWLSELEVRITRVGLAIGQNEDDLRHLYIPRFAVYPWALPGLRPCHAKRHGHPADPFRAGRPALFPGRLYRPAVCGCGFGPPV